MATELTTGEIAELYIEQRLSLAEIGARVGITKQAVAGRLRRAGIERRRAESAKRSRYELWCRQCGATIDRLVPEYTIDVIAERLGAPRAWVRRYVLDVHGLSPYKRSRQLFTDDQLLSELSEVARVVDGPVTIAVYTTERSALAASAHTLIGRFGSWSAACARVGVSCGHAR